ncbi:MAG: sigma 54-interacting transcriptional regulator [Deltaproteobacteria bacterium]|nr:sigma 54-interacting transcriptional regulator [Deltaproteobacteria bacterium]
MNRGQWEAYRILVEKLSDGVGISQNGRLVYVNDSLCSMFGCRPGQILGADPAVVFGEAWKPELGQENSGSEENTFIRCSASVCIGRTDRQRRVKVFYIPVWWKGKPALLLAVKDIAMNGAREDRSCEEAEQRLEDEGDLKPSRRKSCKFAGIIGESRAMKAVYELIVTAAETDAPVVIHGESGTGKELVARAIHRASDRHRRSFVAVNCGAIPENLLESEFFGHKRGAFTGAQFDKNGFLDIADKGTLFLDEVGELAPGLQVKLLRAVEGNGYIAVGDTRVKKSDFRIISATNRDLKDMVDRGLMRHDFFYRLHVILITVPPLKERKEDIPLLVDHFLHAHGYDEPGFIPSRIMKALMEYDWPGNVRELQNVLHRYVAVKRLDFVNPQGSDLVTRGRRSKGTCRPEDTNFHGAVRNFEKRLLLRALKVNRWQKARAASMLGLPRRTFYRKLKCLGLDSTQNEPFLAQP